MCVGTFLGPLHSLITTCYRANPRSLSLNQLDDPDPVLRPVALQRTASLSISPSHLSYFLLRDLDGACFHASVTSVYLPQLTATRFNVPNGSLDRVHPSADHSASYRSDQQPSGAHWGKSKSEIAVIDPPISNYRNISGGYLPPFLSPLPSHGRYLCLENQKYRHRDRLEDETRNNRRL